MSLKDRLRFNGVPLPVPGATTHEYVVEGMDGVEDRLEVRADGSLWRNWGSFFHDANDEDRPWQKELITGELLVIHYDEGTATPLRWSLYFVDGVLREVHRVDGRRHRIAPKEV